MTEAEYATYVPPVVQENGCAGRWSTHCSCRITLNDDERQRAYRYVQSLCRTLLDIYPTYRGSAILLFTPLPSQHPQRHRHPHSVLPTNQKKRRITTTTTTTMSSTEPCHVSLTRPDVALHTNHIHSFLRSLTMEIQQLSRIPPFTISLHIPTIPTTTTTTTTLLLQNVILHNPNHTKSFGIWHCSRPGWSNWTIPPPPPPPPPPLLLQQLSNACNRVLTRQYQQASYHYNNKNNSRNNNTASQEEEGGPPPPTAQEPIYHISLVRFEPCLYDYMQPPNPILHGRSSDHHHQNDENVDDDDDMESDHDDDTDTDHDDDDDSACSSHDDDDDVESSSDVSTTNHNLHYVDHMICNFGGGAKVYHIPLCPS